MKYQPSEGRNSERIRQWLLGAVLLLGSFLALPAGAQLDPSCTVSILNRSTQVQPDGTWRIDNVPANFGPVRARATCVRDGLTVSGQSEYFQIAANVVTGFDGRILLGAVESIPVSLTITSLAPTLTAAQPSVQLTVMATYPDGRTADVTAATAGTMYTISNPAVVRLSSDGFLTALASGTILISATNDGTLGLLQLTVQLSQDTDGDGLPNDFELANDLDPSNPADALSDPDQDGLTIFDEFRAGLDPFNSDSDKDGLLDGREVNELRTNPLLGDTDGDGLWDGLEVLTASDPLDPNSFNLSEALESLQVSPAAFTLIVNTIMGEVSQQLAVTGRLIDGRTLNLTATAKGTNYTSSDFAVCNFGSESGRIFAGASGTCTITARNSGFSGQATGTVRAFSPTALSFLPIPGGANNVDVNGNYAYLAAGRSGLLVVNVANRTAPFLAGYLQLPGYANDVKIVGDLVLIADGPAGLEIVDISDPASPVLIGSIDTPGDAQDVAVSGNRALVADGPGIQIVDISTPAQPVLVSTVPPPAGASFLDVRGVDREGDLAVFSGLMNSSGSFDCIGVIDLRDELNPVVISQARTGNAQDVVLRGRFAFVADLANSFTVVDLDGPTGPVVVVAAPRETGGLLADVAIAGGFAFGADIFFVNGVPIINIANPASSTPTAIVDFSRYNDDNGTGIAVDSRFVYLTGATGLFIGRYLGEDDTYGIPPTVAIIAPAPGTTIVEGSSLAVTVQAMDDVGVASVDFLVDGAIVFTDTVAPYQFNLTAPAGVRNLAIGARGTDSGGNASLAQEVQVTVMPNQPPMVTIIAPAPGATIVEGGSLPIAVQVTDDVGVSVVDFLVDGTVVFTDITAPYEYNLIGPAGARNLTIGARATDIGGMASLAQEVQVTVTPNQAPIVSIVSPAAGTTVMEGARLPISVHVMDDLGVASVTFLANGSPAVTDSLPPYKAILTVPVDVTELILGATATDLLGVETAAAEVPLTVIPDPDTTVVGRVLDGDRLPVDGAEVRCVGVQGLSGSDGLFSITVVPTVQGSVQCIAFGTDNLSGRSMVVLPVLGATTDVGDLILSRRPLYPGAKFGVGNNPFAIVAGDFDGDGVQDLATANWPTTPQSVADLSVLLGIGDGTFGPEQRLGLEGYIPQALVAADFNGDGKLDLASAGVGQGGDSCITVFLGNGDGSFLPLRRSTAGMNPYSIVTADFNRDGILDLATVDVKADEWGFSGLSVLLGNGDGTFAPRQSVAVGDQPASLAVGDFNGDGDADLVTANYPSQDLSLLLGDGNGTFRPELRFGQGLGANSYWQPSIAVGDFNGDGRADVVAARTQKGETGILLGNGDGTFQPAVSYDAGVSPSAVWPVDLDGDGQLDLVTLGGVYLCLLRGTGIGSFLPPQCFHPYKSDFSTAPTVVAVADLNSDRLADFVVAFSQQSGASPSGLIVFMGDGDGAPETLRTVAIQAVPSSVAMGDLDRDGSLDIVTLNGDLGNPHDVSVLLGHGDGTFDDELDYELGDCCLHSLALADFNRDGTTDLASADAVGSVSILLGNGDGTFQARQLIGVGNSPWQVKEADLDADGTPDLVVPQRDAGQVLVLLGHGDGTFRKQPAIGVGSAPVAVAIGDFNHDGALDFVSVNSSSQDLSVVLGNGDGTFQPETRVQMPSSTLSAIAAADLDSDGATDLVATTPGTDLQVLLSNGDGTFQTPVSYTLGSDPTDVVVADIDLDGQLDLLAVDYFLEEVSVLLGNGDGTFQSRQRFATLVGGGGGALAVGDLDRDGVPDLVAANHRQLLSILIGGGSPSRVGTAGPFTDTRRASLSGPTCTMHKEAFVWAKETSIERR